MKQNDIKKLVAISGDKRLLLEDIRDITIAQQEAIEQKDLDKLGQLINKKQEKIDSMIQLDKDFEGIYENIKSQYGNINIIQESHDENFIALQNEISGIMQIVDELKVMEKNNSLKLNQQKNEVGKKLQEIRSNKVTINKYVTKPLPPKPAFFDKKK